MLTLIAFVQHIDYMLNWIPFYDDAYVNRCSTQIPEIHALTELCNPLQKCMFQQTKSMVPYIQ